MQTTAPMESELLHRLQSLYDAMPPVAALQLVVAGFDGHCLRLHAPLALHVNDKGCAFGGSLASLMTLAGWGLVSLALWRAGLAADVFVAQSEVHYRAPLHDDLHASAQVAADASLQACAAAVRDQGRGRVAIAARVALPDGGDACTMQARYVAIRTR